jgi:PAS domain S-box-containing protein
MAELMRGHDWSATPLGPPEQWPHALKVALRILLTSRFEMWLGWGPQVHFFYNDAYRPTLGIKHPQSLGMPTRELWPEIWDSIEGRIRSVYERGEATWDRALLLLLERSGYPEETYHTFSYSPLLGDDGKVGGLFCAVTEETARVISERRLATLSQLSGALAVASTPAAVIEATSASLSQPEAERDATFCLVYRFEPDGDARLLSCAGIAPGTRLSPAREPADGIWQSQRIQAGQPFHAVALSNPNEVPLGAWDKPATQAVVVPLLRRSDQALGFMVCGINPYLRLDSNYTTFLQLLAGQVATSLANVEEAERRNAERDRLRLLFRQAPSFFCVLDGPEHRFQLMNESYRTLVGQREVQGKTVAEALPEVAGQGFIELLDEVYTSRKPYVGRSVEIQLRQSDGQLSTRYVDFVYQPIIEDSGACSGIFVDGSDVTDKVQAERELRELNSELEARIATRTRDLEAAMESLHRESQERQAVEESLRQAQKMEAVGQLTGGIAHDFNNLLQGITGSLDLLKVRLQLGKFDNIERLVTAAMSSADRAAKLTQRLLAFSRRQPLDPKPVRANQLISPMEELLRRTLGENIRIELVLAAGLWTTTCDPHQLESALLNLGINARDAMPNGGVLTIETSNAWLDDDYARHHPDLAPGQYVCISVSDNGCGMTPEVLAKAFDPFFTTKPVGQGTGLGLSMIYGFAKQSHGHARLYSEPGRGTTAKLYLPRHHGDSAPAEPVPAPGEEHQSRRGEVVLVVEDDALVRSLVIDVLFSLGYRTLEAADGAAALRVLETPQQRIDLLVTDLGLPTMNGRQLHDAAQRMRPGLKVLFMTGYAENATLAGGLLAPGMEVVSKPFTMEKIARKISQMLERQPASGA